MLIKIQPDATVCRYLFTYFAVNKYLHTVAFSWIFINMKNVFMLIYLYI